MKDLGLEDITDGMVMSELEAIYAWSPGRAEEKLPPTQVHLVCKVPGLNMLIFVWRIKTREGMDYLIRALQQKRDEVWPGGE